MITVPVRYNFTHFLDGWMMNAMVLVLWRTIHLKQKDLTEFRPVWKAQATTEEGISLRYFRILLGCWKANFENDAGNSRLNWPLFRKCRWYPWIRCKYTNLFCGGRRGSCNLHAKLVVFRPWQLSVSSHIPLITYQECVTVIWENRTPLLTETLNLPDKQNMQ